MIEKLLSPNLSPINKDKKPPCRHNLSYWEVSYFSSGYDILNKNGIDETTCRKRCPECGKNLEERRTQKDI